MFSNISDYIYIWSWKQVLVGWSNFFLVTLEMGFRFDSVDGRFLKERDLIFIVHTGVSEALIKTPYPNGSFGRHVDSRHKALVHRFLKPRREVFILQMEPDVNSMICYPLNFLWLAFYLKLFIFFNLIFVFLGNF